MSQFLQRNKKKGSLAALLLFFKRGKGAGPLMLLVGMLSFVFIAPSNILGGIPFFQKIAAKLGLQSALGGGGQLPSERMEEILREARARRAKLSSPGALFGRGANGGGRYGKSSVGMVKGGDLLADANGKAYDAVGGDAESVDGVLRPEDSKDMKEGVNLSEEELLGGLMAKANAGGLENQEGLTGDDFKADFQGLRGYKGLGSGNSSLGGARPYDPNADLVKNQMARNKTPGVGRTTNIRGTRAGKLSARRFRGISARVSGAMGDARGGNKKVMHQLAESRAYSVSAAPPPGGCDPGSCGNETASTVAGRPFDGSQVADNMISAAEFGDPTVSDLPDLDGAMAEADKLADDAEACQDAQNKWSNKADKSSQEITRISNEINSKCSGGGCKTNKSTCKRLSNEMKAECRTYNGIMDSWAGDCPLMNSPDKHGGC
jgi:hypothetical protein